jgi:tetrahydromethanopterin S-methyltransferase subunit B
MLVGKFIKSLVGWIIGLALVALVAYALFFSDLPADVLNPFQPPRR